MTDFAALGSFNTDDTLTEGELRQALEDQLRATLEFPGAKGSVLHTIGVTGGTPADSITPASAEPGMIRLAPQSGTADNLTRILQTNARDGALLYLRLNSDSYRITLQPGGASPGNLLLLYGESAYLLSNTSQASCFERQGTTWREIIRTGSETSRVVGDPGEPGFAHADWSAAQAVHFHKDASGCVSLWGQPINTTSADTNSTIFTLPVGYRPPATMTWVVDDTTADKLQLIVVQTTGDVIYTRGALGAKDNSIAVSLAPIRFRVA